MDPHLFVSQIWFEMSVGTAVAGGAQYSLCLADSNGGSPGIDQSSPEAAVSVSHLELIVFVALFASET